MVRTYGELIGSVCKLLNLHGQQQVMKGEPFYVNEVLFTLIHDAQIDADRIYLFASFGKLPQGHEVPVLEELLQQNLAGFAGDGPGFCISPATGVVNYARNLSLKAMTPRDLAMRLVYVAGKAAEWRRDYFLGADWEREKVAGRGMAQAV